LGEFLDVRWASTGKSVPGSAVIAVYGLAVSGDGRRNCLDLEELPGCDAADLKVPPDIVRSVHLLRLDHEVASAQDVSDDAVPVLKVGIYGEWRRVLNTSDKVGGYLL
jgi:hypothetical protein